MRALNPLSRNPVAYLSPYGWNHEVASIVAVADEAVWDVSDSLRTKGG
jgi:hypothetical protein